MFNNYLNGCDEVLQFLYETLEMPCVKYTSFQGDDVPVYEDINISRMGWDALIISPKYDKTVFVINKFRDVFTVSIIKSADFKKALLTIQLPIYCYDEFIATARGWW